MTHMTIKHFIRTIPDYPSPGIQFRDITTLLSDPAGFANAVDGLVALHEGAKFDVVAGIKARGFILGGAVAHRLSLGFVPVRKKGKLPWKTLAQEYDLEYGTDTVEIHEDALQPGARVLLIDDLIATGRSEEHTSELQSRPHLVCRLLLEKKKKIIR